MAAAEIGITTEQERIEQWRFDALVRAGYDPDAAAAIAPRADIDLHYATELIRRGCSPELALAILL